MTAQPTTELGIHVQLKQPYETAIERTRAALKVEGFGVLPDPAFADIAREALARLERVAAALKAGR